MSHLKRILQYTLRYWQRLVASGITATLFGLFSAAPTYGLQYVIDTILVAKNHQLLLPFIGVFIVLFVLKGLFMYASNYYMNWVGSKVVNDIRSDLFKKIIYYPTGFFQEKSTGQLMSYFLSDITMIQNASSSAIRNGVRSIFEAVFLLAVAFIQNWQLAALMLTLGPIIAYSINRMGSYMRTTARTTQNKMGDISSVLQEIFVGIREIKSFNGEQIEVSRFNRYLHSYFGSIMRNVRIVSLTPAFIEVLAMTGSSAIFYVAAYQVLNGIITPGQLASFFASLLLAYQPLKRLINVYADVQSGVAAASRIFEIMDLSYPALHNRPVVLSKFSSDIVCENMSFSYVHGHPVLEGVNLLIQKGETIGLVGPSGSGKSTLCDLLLGFIEPTEGFLMIDSHNIARIGLESLRSRIGYVGQRPFLFNDTIMANVRYGSPHATQEEIENACKQAYADRFIEELPHKYNTMVGENGSQLSGGQKQRLTIARALLKNPEILIFDEATSALDVQSEHMIRRALEEIRIHKTVIIISHRLSFVESLDRIFTISNRQVIEISKSQLFAIEQRPIRA